MSDDTLVISGGGSSSVATDDGLDRVQRLEAFVDTSRLIVDQLVAVNGMLTEAELVAAGAPASASAMQAKREIATALPVLSNVSEAAHRTAASTRAAMLEYGLNEAEQEDRIRRLYADLGKLFGFMAGNSAFIAGGAAVFAMGFISTDTAPSDDDDDDEMPDASQSGELVLWAAKKYFDDHPEWINNATFVEIVKLIVDSVDDWMLAAAYIPGWLVDKLKEMGVTGPELAAAILIASGRWTGKLTESGTKIAKSKKTVGTLTPPTGWEDRIARLPDTATNGGYQIKVEKYVDAGGKRSFEVYVTGTQTFSTSKTDTPFDQTSNMYGVAGQDNASLEAVEKAMKQAGIKPGDPVNITGHSQGGLIAHEVAATGHWNVQVALEAGPPAAHTPLPKGTTEVVLAHNEDVVTALGGSRDDNGAIVVKATAFPDGNIPTGQSTPPAHDTARYQHTAKELDGAASSLVNEAKAKANASSKGASSTVTTTYYKAERVH